MKLHSTPALGPKRLFWIDGFLGAEECARILEELQFVFWSASTVLVHYGDQSVKSVRSQRRLSESTLEEWFSPELMRIIRTIQKRIAPLIPGIYRRRERWQATRYMKGGRFDYHYDCGKWGDDPAGERVHTVLIYLDTPRRGGSTQFPGFDLDIKARAGRLLAWKNLTAEGLCDRGMLHASAPLKEGRKTTLVTWVRQRAVKDKER
jgi:prolyl 4-hydroxylase